MPLAAKERAVEPAAPRANVQAGARDHPGKAGASPGPWFDDQRTLTLAQRALAGAIQQGPLLAAQRLASQRVQASPLAVLQRRRVEQLLGQGPSSGPTAGARSLPSRLQAGMEALSGLGLGHVRVHHDSARPGQIHALAFAQGSDIHLAPGQAMHLPHEAWHVVQQMQGRVRPGLQIAGQDVNVDARLEAEADRMGQRSLETVPGDKAVVAQPLAQHPAVIQGLFGVEVEANIPVFAPLANWPDLGADNALASEVLAFLGGSGGDKETYLHRGGPGSDKPYSISLDSGGPTKECIAALIVDWTAKATLQRGLLSGLHSKPKRAEYITEPYSERYTEAPDPTMKPGLFAFFRDLRLMQQQIQADLVEARTGNTRAAESGVQGAPSLAAWQAAAQFFGLPGHAVEGQAAFDAVALAITDQLYVQSTLGVLPEAVAALYEQEQGTALGQFPLSRAAMAWDDAETVRDEDEAILGEMERSALAQARALALTLALNLPADRETFAGFMATILIEIGGEAIVRGGNKSGGVLKNVSSLLSKVHLLSYQAELPAAVIAQCRNEATRTRLAAAGIVWLRAVVDRANTMLGESGHSREASAANAGRLKPVVVPDNGRPLTQDEREGDDVDAHELVEGAGISYRQFQNRITELLAGTEDRLYDEQLHAQGSGLSAENPVAGAASGPAAIQPDGRRSKAIAFEVRGPAATSQMASARLLDYAQTLVTRLRRVNDPKDDRSAEREAALAVPRRMAAAARQVEVADKYSLTLQLWVIDAFTERIDADNVAGLDQALDNLVAGYRGQLTPAEQTDFDLRSAARYHANSRQYLLDSHTGQLPFMVIKFEGDWLKEQHASVAAVLRPLLAPPQRVDPVKEIPLARATAELSLTLKSRASDYTGQLLAAADPGVWRTQFAEPFAAGDYQAYVQLQLRAIDYSGELDTLTTATAAFAAASLARLEKSFRARLKGLQVATAIYDRAAVRYQAYADDAQKALFWAAFNARYTPTHHAYVAREHPVDLEQSRETIEGGLDAFSLVEIAAVSAIAV